MLFFALSIFIILKTLKDGEPDTNTSYGSYGSASTYTGAGGEFYTGAGSTSWVSDNTVFPQDELYTGEDLETVNDTKGDENSLNEHESSTGLSLKQLIITIKGKDGDRFGTGQTFEKRAAGTGHRDRIIQGYRGS